MHGGSGELIAPRVISPDTTPESAIEVGLIELSGQPVLIPALPRKGRIV
jgi:hypothetical protein